MQQTQASHRKSHRKLRALCEGAVLIAVAEILSFLPLWKMPWGGSIDLAMLPVLIYCLRWGFGPGMLVSVAHALLQTLFESSVAVIGWQSIVGDFLLAYAVLGVAGLFSGRKNGFYFGTLAACGLRFLVHYVVGATLWAEYMPEIFFGLTMTSPWFYSALYNGFYMAIDTILILVIGWLLTKTPLQKFLVPEPKG